MVLWPLLEAGRAIWWALFDFGWHHPVLAVTLVLFLAGVTVVLFVERE